MSSSKKGRHRARGRAAQTGTRVGAVAAAVTSIAVVGGGTIPAAPASAAPFVLSQNCAGGSGQALSNVNCANSIASPIGSVIAGALPADLAAVLTSLKIDLNSSAVVLGSNGTATISGTGFALAAQALNLPLFGGVGGTSTADAVTPLSAAIAVGIGKGNASATAISGVAVAASGSGTASAFSVGGVATAINILGVKNVTCTALYATAGADGVGSCTSVLYVFTAKNAAGSDAWTFAIADPTSLTIGGDGALPIPHFTRDLIRVSVGGPGGIAVGTDLFALPSVSSSAVSRNVVSVSSKVATTPVVTKVSKAVVLPQVSASVRQASSTESAVPSESEAVDATPSTDSDGVTGASDSADTTGKHRKLIGDSAPGFALGSATSAQPTGTSAQHGGTSAQPGGTTAQPGGTSAQPGGTSAQHSGTSAQPGGTSAQHSGTSAQPGGTSAQPGGGVADAA